MVHRDVSPQNILVSTKGVAKVIDFGIAKARDRVSGDTSTGQVKGKVRYMAPEQAMGRTIDRRADVWAIGAILYHMLSGKPPYDGETDVQALMTLTSGLPPVPLPPTVPPPWPRWSSGPSSRRRTRGSARRRRCSRRSKTRCPRRR